MKCDGYDHPKKKTAQALSQIKPKAPLLPKNTVSPMRDPSPTILHTPNNFPYENHEDFEYYRYFQTEATTELSGGWDDPLWNRVILQICLEAPCIQLFTLAVAGFVRAKRSKIHGEDEEKAKSHREYALKQYGHSLRYVRNFIDSNGAPEPKMLLTGTLLVYCFEWLNENEDAAIVFVRKMTLLLKETVHDSSLVSARYRNFRPTGQIETDLVSAMARLDGQLLSRPDNDDPYRGSVLGLVYEHVPPPTNMPERFEDIYTARKYLENIQYRSRPDMLKDALDVGPHTHFGKKQKSTPGTRRTVFPREDLRFLRQQLALWWSAFKPIVAHCKYTQQFIPTTTLQIQALATSVTLQRSLGLGAEGVEDQFGVDHPLACWDEDVLQRTCKEIISFSSKLMADKAFSKGFVFDNGIISCIFDVVLLCPEQDLRKEAVEILRQLVPRREGIWSSVTLLKKSEEMLGMSQTRSEKMSE
jgi:hypothetical protein